MKTTPTTKPTQQKTILLLGSTGFIGQKVTQGLKQLGYHLRTPKSDEVDFLNPNWQKITEVLNGIDVVINMVGVMSQDKDELEQVHHHKPIKIAKLAKRFHVKHWINLSALGADDDYKKTQHKVAFVSSKGRGDTALLKLAEHNDRTYFKVSIARPSLVFGRGGASCEMFLNLAKLPLLVLPNAGRQQIQPVHVNDVAQGLINLATTKTSDLLHTNSIINFTGCEPCSLKDYLTMLRTDIHDLPPPRILSIPNVVVKTGITLLTPFLSSQLQSMMSQDSLILLNEGSIADHDQFSQLLKREPLGYRQFSQYN